MNAVDELLLSGRLVDAEATARRLLAATEDVPTRTGFVRALVWLVRPSDAAHEAASLPMAGEALVGHALARLANGEPGRGRSLLVEGAEPTRSLLYSVTLAELHRATGDAAAAVQEAGRAHERTRDADVRWRGTTGMALGRALADAGDEECGEVVVREALSLFETHCANTVLVAEALDVAGSLARRLREPARAVLLHRRALEIWEGCLGPTSGNVAACRYGLAQALHRTGDFSEALVMMQGAFLVTVRVLGADHLDTWITRFELGRMEVDAGEMMEGFPRMEAARAEVATRLGAQHPVVRSMDRWL